MTASISGQKPTTAQLGALLNQSVLQLSPDVRVFRLATERLALKYQPGRRYLIVTPEQWTTLQEFKGGRRVTDVLCGLISTQRNPSLRDRRRSCAEKTDLRQFGGLLRMTCQRQARGCAAQKCHELAPLHKIFPEPALFWV